MSATGAGHAGWVRVTHWITTVSVLTLAVSGFFILMVHPRLYWGKAGNDLTPPLIEFPISPYYPRDTWTKPTQFAGMANGVVTAGRTEEPFNQNGWARSLHFLAGWLLVIPGLMYLLAGLFGGHFRSHVVPRSADLSGPVLKHEIGQHLRLRIPKAKGGPDYGPLQKLAYTMVIFIAAPVIVLTGLTMAPAVTAAWPWLLDLFGGHQSARTIHFFAFVLLLGFVLVHLLMVVMSGFRQQIRSMTVGDKIMSSKRLITRRQALFGGLAAVAGGTILSRIPGLLPPSYGNLLRMGDAFTYSMHRALFPKHALVREYSVADITSFPATGTIDPGLKDTPGAETYRRLRAGGFVDWRLSVEGKVARPRSYSLAELKALPARTQITRHTCEEGWSAIGQWTGVPLRTVLEAAGLQPTARWVKYQAYDGYVDCLDLVDAFHPQTILTYGMNGRDLPIPHGGPLRLRLENQIGYKSMKYVHRLLVTDEFDDGGAEGAIQNGWAWYTGI